MNLACISDPQIQFMLMEWKRCLLKLLSSQQDDVARKNYVIKSVYQEMHKSQEITKKQFFMTEIIFFIFEKVFELR